MEIFKSNKDNKYRYLYKIINTLTGQYYYGIHTTYNINDNYMGSGADLKKDIKKIGVANFNKIYLKFFNDDKSLREAEKNIITTNMLNDPLCYNILPGGGGFNNKGIYPVRNILTGEIKAMKINEEYDKTIWIHITKNRKRISKTINNINIIKFVYKEHLQKYLDEGWTTYYGGNLTGKIKINNGIKIKYIDKEHLQKYLDEGWKKGGLPIGCKGRLRIINKDNNKEKMIHPSELQKYLDEGWKKGSLHKGKIQIYKNDIQKMIHPSELQKYLDEGWKKGSFNNSILGKIKIIKDNKCKVIHPSEFQKYLDEGWKKGSKGTTTGKILISNEFFNIQKMIHPSEFQKYLDEGWKKGSKK